MNSDILYVNGDSFTAEDWTVKDRPLVWPDYLSHIINLELCNSAIIGSSNVRIFRRSISDIIQFLNNGKTPLVLIGLSFIRRQEVWEENIFCCDREHPFDKNGSLSGPTTLDKAVKRASGYNLDYYKTKILIEVTDVKNMVLDFYMELFLFVSWLEKNNLNYYIFSAANNTYESPDNHDYAFLKEFNFFNEIIHNPKIDDLHNFSFVNWSSNLSDYIKNDSGHLSSSGHEKMANFLYKKLIDRSIIFN